MALDTELHREVALKQILDRHADDPVSRSRFLVEAEITGGLEHPGIVPVYGLGTYGQRPAVLRDAVHQGRQPQGSDRRVSRRRVARSAILAGARSSCGSCCGGSSTSATRSSTRTAAACCTATSSRATSSSASMARHWWSTGAWPSRWAVPNPAAARRNERWCRHRRAGAPRRCPGSALGTPAFMSPEQAAGDLDRLGPRSDVYSLGATLYVLLTGRPPFEGDDLGVMLQAVWRGDSRHRESVDPSIDRSLEAICLKAMARPEDRYAIAAALADDIERWMADEPVSARREPFSERARRWARRNRTAVTAGIAAALVAVVGLAAVLAVQTWANRSLSAKNGELTTANVREAHANLALAAANAQVQARFDLAMEAVKILHTGVSEDVVLKRPEFVKLRNRLLKASLESYRKLSVLLDSGSGDDRKTRSALAMAYLNIASLTSDVGSEPDAALADHQAIAILERLVREGPDDVPSRRALASGYNQLSILQSKAGQSAESLATQERAVRLFEELVEDAKVDPRDRRRDLAKACRWLGELQSALGTLKDAMATIERSRRLQEELAAMQPTPENRFALATIWNSLGMLHARTGNSEKTVEAYERCREILEELVQNDPDDEIFRTHLATARDMLSPYYLNDGRHTEAQALNDEARTAFEELLRTNPNRTETKNYLAICYFRRGLILDARDRPEEAFTAFEQARRMQEALVREHPQATWLRNALSWTNAGLGRLHAARGRPGEAVVALKRRPRPSGGSRPGRAQRSALPT